MSSDKIEAQLSSVLIVRFIYSDVRRIERRRIQTEPCLSYVKDTQK